MRIALGSDHAGFDLKSAIVVRLEAAGHRTVDMGCSSPESVDYPDYAAEVGRAVAAGEFERGILVCGTGVGIAMAANKIPGVRAAVVHDRFTAQMSREHNDANILCLGARVLDMQLALELAVYWLTVEFEGGRHERRVKKIGALDCREGT
ncbi:MAG: ribose 5-phosphate isomerase B [Planctomycetota bacterium]|jgi:ribose 5-phosphate isomerase B